MEEDVVASNKAQLPSSFLSTNVLNTNLLQQSELPSVDLVSENFFSSIRTRSLLDSGEYYDANPVNTSIPEHLAMDFSRIVNKPFLINQATWKTTDAISSVIFTTRLMSDVLAFLPAGSALLVPFESATYYRVKAKILLQCAGTPMHQGTILASSLPLSYPLAVYGGTMIESLMNAPHAFLSANSSTAVCLEVPFYSNLKYQPAKTSLTPSMSYDNNNGDFAQIRLTVLNPLNAPTNGTTSVTISVHLVLEDVQFYVPHSVVRFVGQSLSDIVTRFIDKTTANVKNTSSDFIDLCRNTFRGYTGLHNPNDPNSAILIKDRESFNAVDSTTHFDKLDPYTKFDRITREPIFETYKDEMLLSNILTKPQYVGTFNVASTVTRGTVVFSRPIYPLYSSTGYYSGNLQVLSMLSKFWKGSLKIHIQSSMSNFHFCKLLFVRDYAPTISSLTKVPQISDISNLMVESCEFSGGGQVQTFVLPYISAFDQLPITTDTVLNALIHGMYYIYVDQPLVSNGSVSTTVSFNVYISAGDDFQLFGYTSDNKVLSPYTKFSGQSLIDTSSANNQIMMTSAKETEPPFDNTNFKQVVSVRDYLRRFYAYPISLSLDSEKPFVFPLNTLLNLNHRSLNGTVPPSQIISWMYFGFSGGFKLKLRFMNAKDVTVKFIPPQMRFDSMGVVPSTILLNGTTPVITGVNTIINQSLQYAVSPNYTLSPTVSTETANKPVRVVDGVLESEFLIPNYSPYRFIGDLAMQDINTQGPTHTTVDMGYLVITAVSTAKAVGSIFFSFSDESRFGFQVCCPTISVPNFDDSSIKYQAVTAVSTIAGMPLKVLPTEAASCYITK